MDGGGEQGGAFRPGAGGTPFGHMEAIDPVVANARLRRAGGQQQDEPSPARSLGQPQEQRLPCRAAEPIMAKDDAAAARQPTDRGDQRIIRHPFVGEQPEAGQGAFLLAAVHSSLYSGAMTDASPDTAPESPLETVRAAIARAARLAGRAAGEVHLIAISKTQPVEAIAPLIAAGHRDFGENRVQEAQAKWPGLKAGTPDLMLHCVGQLQSNKAAEAVALFDVIHSVDRPSLVKALADAMRKQDRWLPCFLQVNIGDELQKGGCAIADLPVLLAEARAAGLDVVGLMCVPPADREAAPYFALLAKLAREQGLKGLSMGMSGDFETAVMLGATHVRVGTALFGSRNYSA